MTIPPNFQSYAGVITLRLSLGALCTFLTLLNREKKIIYDLLFSYVFFSLSRFHSMALKRKTSTAVAQVIFNFGRKHPLGYRQFVARRSAELNA